MDGYAHLAREGVLFAEDFDTPSAAAAVEEPDVIEPVFSTGDLAAARSAAWQEGHAEGLRQAEAQDAAGTRQAIAAIAEQFTAERAAGAVWAEQSADAIARLLVESLAAMFPALCTRYGDAEVRAIVRIVLPALTQEPAITVRAHPRTAEAVAHEIALLDADLMARVHVVESGSVPPGDVRIAWRSGSAVRDAAGLWHQIAAVLAPAGLLRADATKETIDGD